MKVRVLVESQLFEDISIEVMVSNKVIAEFSYLKGELVSVNFSKHYSLDSILDMNIKRIRNADYFTTGLGKVVLIA